MRKALKKRLSNLILVIFIFATLTLGVSSVDLSGFILKAEAVTSGYYTYTVSNNEATITDVDASISGQITIPSKLGGYPVTSIGMDAFSFCYDITKVTISNNVTSIDCFAFYGCTNLTSVTIGRSVTKIGDGVFIYCPNLTSITVNSENSSYSSDECSVLFNKDKTELIQYPNAKTNTNYVIPDGVIIIHDYAFMDCSNILNVSIPDSVISIGYRAFFNCTRLTNITIPDNVILIDADTFYNCESLTNIAIPDSVTSIGESAFEGCENLVNVTIGNNVTSIGFAAFSGCYSLASVTLPDSLTSIDEYSFYGCCSLTTLTIPGATKSIGESAFFYCYGLTNISVDENNPTYSSDSFGVLFNKNKTKLIQYPAGNKRTSYVIPNNVINIGDFSFYAAANLIDVIIPDTVTNLGVNAFSYLNGLTSITIPDSVTSIADRAFEGCVGLVSIIIPDSVTNMDYFVFKNCENLTCVRIGDGVTKIGDSAFYGCSSLTNVTIGNSVTKIIDYAFEGCTNLARITIPNSVTSIAEGAFSACESLIDVYYTGTEEQWNKIDIYDGAYSGNEALFAATIHFDFEPSSFHHYTATIIKEANCIEKGVATYICECGDSYTEDVAKISHNESEWEVISETSCITRGRKIKKCTVCGTIIKSEPIPFANHLDSNSDGLCDICDKISNLELVKGFYISIATPENRTINYMESVKLYATTANLPEGYKIKWKVEGEGVSIRPSINGKNCTVTSTSTGNVVIKAYVVDSNGNIVTDENGKQICDSEYFYSEANLWLRIIYFFKKLFGISISTAQAFKGII